MVARLSGRAGASRAFAASPDLVHMGSTWRHDTPRRRRLPIWKEISMQQRRQDGRRVWPFVLIPVSIVALKAMRRRRMAQWGLGPEAMGHHGHGGYGRSAGSRGMEGGPAFRLPPKIESVLEAWHTRAHQGGEPADVSV